MTLSLQALQERYGPALADEIAGWIALLDQPAFAGIMRYQLGEVDEQLRPTPGVGGKRFRPLLCLAVCAAAGGDWHDALAVAAAIELLHNFSLIHDDIEDRDPTRHHRPTVWKVWGEPQAINAGDAMLALANRAASSSPQDPQVAVEIDRQFSDTTLQLTQGQYLDMSFEGRQDVTPQEYMAMIACKTGALIRFSAWSGAFIAGARDRVVAGLRAFGAELGAAFQIHDDVQGIWGVSAKTGKEEAGDLRNRKITLPVLEGFSRADGGQRRVLSTFYRRDSDDVDAVLRVLAATGARAEAEAVLREHRRRALAALHDALDGSAGDLTRLVSELTGG